MPVKTIPVAELARRLLVLSSRPRGEWVPPRGQAALEFRIRPDARLFGIGCVHGRHEASFADINLATSTFEVGHPQCRLAWVHGSVWPAAEAVPLAFGVTASSGPDAQAELQLVRANGERAEAYVATHTCRQCSPGQGELAPLGRPQERTFALEHERDCPSLTKESQDA